MLCDAFECLVLFSVRKFAISDQLSCVTYVSVVSYLSLNEIIIDYLEFKRC